MGDLFRNTQSQQSTANQQVAVQGGVGVGGGTSGVVAVGGTAVQGGIASGSKNATINITDASPDVLHLADDVTNNALASNTVIASESINAAQSIAAQSLESVHDLSGNLAQIASDASQSSQGIVARAAPQSPEAAAELLGAQSSGTNTTILYALVAVAAIIILPKLFKS